MVAFTQLSGIGMDREDIEREIRHGVIELFRRGVYRVPQAPDTWQLHLTGALVLSLPDVAASHTTAARIWDLKIPTPHLVEITVPYGRNTRSGDASVKVHRSRTFSKAIVTVRDGFNVTTVARTFLDLAPKAGQRQLTKALDDAIGRRIVRPSVLLRAMPEPGSRQHPGLSVLRTALDMYSSSPDLDSVAEADFLRLLDDAGLPPPVCHYLIRDGVDVIAEADFAWPAQRVAIEVDGYQYHMSPRDHARDLERISAITALGWFVLVTSPTLIATKPRSVIDSLRCRLT